MRDWLQKGMRKLSGVMSNSYFDHRDGFAGVYIYIYIYAYMLKLIKVFTSVKIFTSVNMWFTVYHFHLNKAVLENQNFKKAWNSQCNVIPNSSSEQFYLNLTKTLWDRGCSYTHFQEKETEAQRGGITLLFNTSHS